MAMKLVKQTAEYSIYKRGDDRYAVKDAGKNPVNAEEKVRILVAEGLITAAVPAKPEPEVAEVAEEAAEETAEEAAAEEEAPAAEEAPAEEASAEEAPAEEPAEDEDK